MPNHKCLSRSAFVEVLTGSLESCRIACRSSLRAGLIQSQGLVQAGFGLSQSFLSIYW
jgi:hypothetical protein